MLMKYPVSTIWPDPEWIRFIGELEHFRNQWIDRPARDGYEVWFFDRRDALRFLLITDPIAG